MALSLTKKLLDGSCDGGVDGGEEEDGDDGGDDDKWLEDTVSK